MVSSDGKSISCAICLSDVFNRAKTDNCLHEFCLQCLKQWSEVPHNTCPVCRQKFHYILTDITRIPVQQFDISFINKVYEQIVFEIYLSSTEDKMFVSKSCRPYGPIASTVEQILRTNEIFMAELDVQKKHCRCPSCLLTMSLFFQNLLIAFTESVVIEMVEEITQNQIQELVLSILKYKRQEFSDFVTTLIEDNHNSEIDSFDDIWVGISRIDAGFESDNDSEEQN